MSKLLFVIKHRDEPDTPVEKRGRIGLPTGLYNSALFLNDILEKQGLETNLVASVDSNDISPYVEEYTPTHIIVEALWITPSTFTLLQEKHPNVKWIIRLHSEMPFMAGEGIAMDWIADYSMFRNVTLACNAQRMLREVRFYLKLRNNWSDEKTIEKVVYLPNYYPQEYKTKLYEPHRGIINIGCFGAIRPLKNHLVQALAAIEFAEKINKRLCFHVNADRIEMKGDAVGDNLKSVFEHINHTGHQLISHPWSSRDIFLDLCSKMDIGMQVSFSETFNIVAADFISQGVPIVTSKEIPWVDNKFCCDPTDSINIVKTLMKTHKAALANVATNKANLTRYTTESSSIWAKYFK